MASFVYKSAAANDLWGLLYGIEQSIALSSVTPTKAVLDAGDFIIEYTGTGLAAGAAPAGTITGAKFYLVDLSVAGGRVEVFSGTGINVSFASFLAAFADDPVGSIDLIFGAADTQTGSAAADQMFGGAGADTINGGDGDDILFGGFGDFETGDGNDSLVGGNGNDVLYGEDGADTLVGGAGNDQLFGDIAAPSFDAGGVLPGGADSMVGGAGNDTYWVDRATDKVVELAGEGTNDRVIMLGSSGLRSYTLAANVENLSIYTPFPSLANPTPPTLTANGNTLNNKISVLNVAFGGVTQGAVKIDGKAGNDRIAAGAGNDTLIGGAGNDSLIGGAGADDFVFNSKVGTDLVYDFKTGSDDLGFSQAGVRVGDGDTVVEGAVVRAASGGFSATAELVIIQSNIAGAITTASAAAKIGDATAAYAVGRTAVFAVDNGSSTGVFLFTAADANADVSAAELTLLGTLTSTPATAVGDYLFVA